MSTKVSVYTTAKRAGGDGDDLWGFSGGTSLATPANTGLAALGWESTGVCWPTKLCEAGPGWDGPTGWGVPQGPRLFAENGQMGSTKATLFAIPAGTMPTRKCLGAPDAKIPDGGPYPVVRSVACDDLASFLVKWQINVPVHEQRRVRAGTRRLSGARSEEPTA